MKAYLENAYIDMRVNGELCRIAAEKAVLYLNEDGSAFQFEAKFLLNTPIDSILRIANRTRMRVSFNGIGQYSFIHSEPGQKIELAGVDFLNSIDAITSVESY